MKSRHLIIYIILSFCLSESIQAKKKEEPVKENKEQVMDGLYGIYKAKNDWFFEIPDSILGRYILTITRYISTPVDGGVYGGEMVNNQTLYWEKSVNNKLLLRSCILNASADGKGNINKAILTSTENPIIGAFNIESSSNGKYKINVTKFFSEETSAVSLPNDIKKGFSLGNLITDRSYIKSIHSYPINTEVNCVKTYVCTVPENKKQNGMPSRGTGAVLPAGDKTGCVTIQLNTSFVLLPKEPMKRRLFDLRVGYFTDQYNYYSDESQSVKEKKFITRWRLEPKDEDIEKMKKGELVEPKKPIVFYIDPATPKQWRKYLIAGINDWQKAFEKAGFKNAIIGKEWPENDSTMSMEDARFSVIRYLASNIPNAYGPQVHDPRSGEIIESHICWYHNVMKLVHDWYMIQAGEIDPRARKMNFDEELMGDLIRFVSSHEVGHTLGLRHNMGASSMTPVEKLRDKNWLKENGHTISIMDYARFNYVAQPEDSITKEGIYPRIGDYDKWAIQWGYMPVDASSDESEHLILNELIKNKLKENPRLWFGSEEIRIDPRSQREDLGDNSMTASEYGIRNLKRIVKDIPAWSYEKSDMFDNVKRIYGEAVDQFQRYLGHVSENIGGLYRNYRSVEQEGKDVYTPVPKATQKQALDFFDKQLFTKPQWLVGEKYIFDLTSSPDKYLYDLIDYVFNPRQCSLLSAETLLRMGEFYESSSANYSPSDYMTDLYKSVFKEIYSNAPISSYRRYLQQTFVKNAIAEYRSNKNNEAGSILLSKLMELKDKAMASSRTSLDGMRKSHLLSISKTIESAIEKKD